MKMDNKIKAFDIIKNKLVDVWALSSSKSAKDYNLIVGAKFFPHLKLTKEEFYFLKEVLNEQSE